MRPKNSFGKKHLQTVYRYQLISELEKKCLDNISTSDIGQKSISQIPIDNHLKYMCILSFYLILYLLYFSLRPKQHETYKIHISIKPI